jgi:hypothetical protein
VNAIRLGPCPKANIGISIVEPSGSTTRELLVTRALDMITDFIMQLCVTLYDKIYGTFLQHLVILNISMCLSISLAPDSTTDIKWHTFVKFHYF